MPNELTRLSPHIDQMRTKLAQNSEHERSLVQSLSDELKRFDQGILRGIRTIAAEHEARRAGILDELQALASSIGTFPAHETPPALEQRGRWPQPKAQASGTFHDELEQSLLALRKEAS
jgi:hypothetical protein